MWTIIESHTVTSLTSSSPPAMAFPNHQCGDFRKRDESAKAARFKFIVQSLENLSLKDNPSSVEIRQSASILWSVQLGWRGRKAREI